MFGTWEGTRDDTFGTTNRQGEFDDNFADNWGLKRLNKGDNLRKRRKKWRYVRIWGGGKSDDEVDRFEEK